MNTEMDDSFQLALMTQSPGGSLPPYSLPEPVQMLVPSRERTSLVSTNDQRFLLVFILGTFFGPDLRNEPPPGKSALQRLALRLPPYTESEVHNSVFRLSEIESIYYYILRNCPHPGARVKLQSLYKFLQGHLAPPVREQLQDVRQFPDFFPPHLHRQSRWKGSYKVIEGLAFLDNPDTSHVPPDQLERFKLLSGLHSLALDRGAACSFQHGQRTDRDEERQARFNAVTEQTNNLEHGVVPLEGPHGSGEGIGIGLLENGAAMRKKRKKKNQLSLSNSGNLTQEVKAERTYSSPPCLTSSGPFSAALLLLPSMPSPGQWQSIINAAKPAISLTGTAATRQAGPLIGLVDVGVCEDAYLFRAALPGVKKDEGEFNCEVECDGQVTIKGTTITGDAQVVKDQRVFSMLSQNLCPPGPFTVAFQLPGPVEPSRFTGTFGSDGILEGVVIKQMARSGSASLTFQS